MLGKIAAISRVVSPVVAGILVGMSYGIPSGIGAAHAVFLWIALYQGWPRARWLAVDAVESAVVNRSQKRLQLTHPCERPPKSPQGALEQWEYRVEELAERGELRDFASAKFQLAEAKAALDEVRSSLLRSLFLAGLTTFVTIGLAVAARSPGPSPQTSALVPADGSAGLGAIVSVTTGIATPIAQIMFILGCCLFVYKRNIAYRAPGA
ncbi:MAG: hypothetical protein ACJ76Y_02615 [Thermoanaerobaculia bacterium]